MVVIHCHSNRRAIDEAARHQRVMKEKVPITPINIQFHKFRDVTQFTAIRLM
jgi:hypothetical protein